MNKSDTLSRFAPDFIAAQKQLDHAKKNAKNPHFKNEYANLAEVIDTVVPVFNDHNLGILQFPGWNDGRVTLETVVIHASGEYISGIAETPIPKSDPQGYGSGTSYLRRYSNAAVANIAQEDDDAEAAMVRKERKAPKATDPVLVEAAKDVAKDPVSAEAMHKVLRAEIAEEGRDWTPAEVAKLQARIRTLFAADQTLGRDAYDAARRAKVME